MKSSTSRCRLVSCVMLFVLSMVLVVPAPGRHDPATALVHAVDAEVLAAVRAVVVQVGPDSSGVAAFALHRLFSLAASMASATAYARLATSSGANMVRRTVRITVVML